MAESQTIVGMKKGKADTVIAAGTIHGGAGNKGTDNHVDKSVNVGGSVGIASTGDYNTGSITTSREGGQTSTGHKKDARTLTSAELLELIRLRECSAGTVKIFADERVTGSEFMDDFNDEFLNDLNITDKTDIRKLKSLQKALSKGDK